ncbi:MAG: hypothetical protein WCG06_06070, partial [Candidatus Omnitrophota bacterium]
MSLTLAALFFCVESFAIEARYVDNRDGTVTDQLTELVWIKDPEKVPTTMGPMVWIKARNCCQDLVYAGS